MQWPGKVLAGSGEHGVSTTSHLLGPLGPAWREAQVLYLPHEERLRDGVWLSLELRQLWRDLTAAPMERVMEREPGCSQLAGRTRGNGHEVKGKRFRQDIRTYSFPMRTCKMSDGASREAETSVPGGFQAPSG